jgi:dipeptidyl aminopeptidase/acylaminoacyl peptidase
MFSQAVQAEYNSEMMGSPIDNRAGYEKWNPANHVAEWSTPTMIIHSGKDFRLVDGQGIGESPCMMIEI